MVSVSTVKPKDISVFIGISGSIFQYPWGASLV